MPQSNPSDSRWCLYVSDSGREVVADEMDALGEAVSAELIGLAVRYERGESLPGEHKSLSDGLHELRLDLQSDTYRLFFGVDDRSADLVLVGLVAFQKKAKRKNDRVVRQHSKTALQRLNTWLAR